MSSSRLSRSSLSVVAFCSLKFDRNCCSAKTDDMYYRASGCHLEKSMYIGDGTSLRILCRFYSNLLIVEYCR